MRKMLLLISLVLLISLAQAQTYVELILDASGSMWNKLDDGRYRIVAAKDVLTQFIGGLPEGDLNVGLRVYGSQIPALEEGACDDSELFVPLSGVDKGNLSSTVQSADALGATPIAKSLLAAADDFPTDASRRLIILVTDGEESCGGDLQAVAEDLRSRGFEIDIRIIGFDLDAKAIASFEGVGTFENAETAQELAQALETAVEDVVVEAPAPETDCDVSIRFDAPAQVEASYPFKVSFEGPEGLIGLHPVNGDKYSSLTAAFARDAEVELLAPSDVGNYELRYTATRGDCVLATATLEVTAIQATLQSPEQIEGGYVFSVDFSGPEGTIAIFKPEETRFNSFRDYSYYNTNWNNKELRAPSEPGSYEVRYYDKNGGLLTANVLEVVAASVTLTSPESVEAGFSFTIDFVGPEGIIAIFKPEETKYNQFREYSYYNTAWNNKELLAPGEPGSYEVRYYDKNEVLLVSNTLEVSTSQATLSTPERVEAGYVFALDFSGPDGIVAIFQPEETKYNQFREYSYYNTAWNAQELIAPSVAGSYEVRYYDKNEVLLVTNILEVTPTTASLSVPAEVAVGSEFGFEFSGPDGIIAIFQPSETKYSKFREYGYYNTAWNNIELTAPETPGTYEVRYYDKNEGLMVSQTITVR